MYLIIISISIMRKYIYKGDEMFRSLVETIGRIRGTLQKGNPFLTLFWLSF